MSVEFGDIIKQELLGKMVEIYQGDSHQSLSGYSDFSVEDKSVIVGLLVDVKDACLILEIQRKDKKSRFFVNTWNISIIHEYVSGGPTIGDAFRPASGVTHERKA